MITYAIILALLTGFCIIHFVLYKVIDKGKSQFLILGVCICYGLITILKKLVIGEIINEYFAQLLTFPLITVTFLLIGVYVDTLFNKRLYSKFSLIFYFIKVCIFGIGVVTYLLIRQIAFYYYGLAFLSLAYVIFSVYYLIYFRANISTDNIILLISVYFMIISYVILAFMTIFDIKQTYYCAIGAFVYIIVAEYVNIKRALINKTSSDSNIQSK